MPRTIGTGAALQMLLTNEWLSAAQARHSGLVNAVVSREELYATAERMAMRLAAADREAVRAAKQAVWRGLDMTLTAGLEMERRLAARVHAAQATERSL